MKNADVHLSSKLLQSYFMYESILSADVDREKLFSSLAETYMIPADKEMFARCASREVQDVSSEEEFYLRERVKKLNALIGRECTDNDDEALIADKGHALLKLHKWGVSKTQLHSQTERIDKVVQLANSGVAPIEGMYGVMLYYGLGVEMAEARGMRYVEKAAAWNDVESILFMLEHRVDKQDYLNRLYTVVAGTPYKELSALAEKKYGLKAEKHGVARLTEDLFERGILSCEQRNFQIARVLESSLLSLSAKQKIVYSENKELISGIAALPCSIKPWSASQKNCLSGLSVARSKDIDELSAALANQEFAAKSGHKPICLCCEDGYVLDLYIKEIKGGHPQVNFVRVDVCETDMSDFRHNADGVLLRSLRGDMANAVIFDCRGEIGGDCMDEVIRFLQSAKREKYSLDYGFSIDLSNVVPICLCDKSAAHKLQKYCTVFNLPMLLDIEKVSVINSTLKGAQGLYGVNALDFEDGAFDMLAKLSVEAAVDVVERIVQSKRGAKKATVTKQQMQSHVGCLDNGIGAIGFGRNE